MEHLAKRAPVEAVDPEQPGHAGARPHPDRAVGRADRRFLPRGQKHRRHVEIDGSALSERPRPQFDQQGTVTPAPGATVVARDVSSTGPAGGCGTASSRVSLPRSSSTLHSRFATRCRGSRRPSAASSSCALSDYQRSRFLSSTSLPARRGARVVVCHVEQRCQRAVYCHHLGDVLQVTAMRSAPCLDAYPRAWTETGLRVEGPLARHARGDQRSLVERPVSVVV